MTPEEMRRERQQRSDLPVVREILARAAALARVESSEYDDDAETRRKLNAHGIDDAEIARQLATLETNSAGRMAVLTSYSLLHGLQHLDAIVRRSPRRAASAEAVITIFRCAEICLFALGILARRMEASLERRRLRRAVANARWRSGLQRLLYRLSALVVETGADPAQGARLDLRRSRAFRDYREATDRLQRFLRTRWPEAPADIFDKGLDDPQRFIFFSEFVNVGDERAWLSRLIGVRVAGVSPEGGEAEEAFYERVVCSDEIEAMVGALEMRKETDLLPFRVIHQISETLAQHVNTQFCGVIEDLVTGPADRLDSVARVLALGNRMLSGVDDSVQLMLRALTPAAYSAIRPNLGMVRGTSSVMLRRTLFNATYPLLVRAYKLRISELSPELAADDEGVEARARALLESDGAEDRCLARVLRELVVFHQHIRTWRDNHLQLPKTHLGVSPRPEQPTVSLSGSDGAVGIAHELRRTHAADPIAPLYRAAHGGSPPDVHELLSPGEFDEHMAHQTAQAVFEVYGDVQERFYQRRRRAAD